MTFFGIISGCPKLSLTLRAVSVQPAEAVYSPADKADGAGLPRQSAARQQKDGRGAALLDLLLDRLGKGPAVDHAFHRREAVSAAQHGSPPSNTGLDAGFYHPCGRPAAGLFDRLSKD